MTPQKRIEQLETALFDAETATREALDVCENFPLCSSTTCPSCTRQKGSKLRAAYDAIHRHILHMADLLSEGVIQQFPERFAA